MITKRGGVSKLRYGRGQQASMVSDETWHGFYIFRDCNLVIQLNCHFVTAHGISHHNTLQTSGASLIRTIIAHPHTYSYKSPSTSCCLFMCEYISGCLMHLSRHPALLPSLSLSSCQCLSLSTSKSNVRVKHPTICASSWVSPSLLFRIQRIAHTFLSLIVQPSLH